MKRVFGNLRAQKLNHTEKSHRFWFCSCVCGGFKIVREDSLKSGDTKSCGCLPTGKVKHGQARPGKRSVEYEAYAAAKQRCINPSHQSYYCYGGRGIKFLFTSFEQFFSEIGNKPEGTSLDRKDNDGHYEPGNVRWATKREQMKNKRQHNQYGKSKR